MKRFEEVGNADPLDKLKNAKNFYGKRKCVISKVDENLEKIIKRRAPMKIAKKNLENLIKETLQEVLNEQLKISRGVGKLAKSRLKGKLKAKKPPVKAAASSGINQRFEKAVSKDNMVMGNYTDPLDRVSPMQYDSFINQYKSVLAKRANEIANLPPNKQLVIRDGSDTLYLTRQMDGKIKVSGQG